MPIGIPEIIILCAVLFLLFGATRLPKLARAVGQSQREFKAAVESSSDEV